MAFTITSSRTSAHRVRWDDSAAFGLVCAQLPTGFEHAEVDYLWRWTDEAGPHKQYGHTQSLRIYGDGSSSYTCDVDLYVIDKANNTVLDDDGTTISQSTPTPSQTVTLTVTDNSAATVWTVTKTGSAIQATDGVSTVHANESTGDDDTGDGTSGTPYATLRKIIAENDADDTVWLLGSGTYAQVGTHFAPSTTSNREISAAPGASVTIVTTGGLIQYGVGEPNSGSDLRIAGITVTPASYVASSLVTFGNKGHFADVSLLDVTCTNLEVGMGWTGADGTRSADMDGVYIHGCDLTVCEFMIFGGGRCQFLGVCDFTLEQTQYVGASQSMFRIYQMRYSCWHRGTIAKASGNPATFRFSAIDESAEGPWGDDGTVANGGFWNSFRDFEVSIDSGVDDGHDLFTFAADSGYTGDWSSRYWEWSGIDFWHDAGGRGIRISGDHSHARDWLISNCRAGRDPGSSTNDRGGLTMFLWVDEFLGTTVRERMRAVHNDIVLYKYRASDWSSLFHTGAVKAGQGFMDFSRNLLIYNVISQTFPCEFNPSLPDTAEIVVEENAFCKTDQYSGTNARSEIVRHSSGGSDRTQAQWISDGIDVNATGYTIAHSTVASTHYDFTAYRTRAGADWEGAATKSPYVRLDVAGNVRGSTTTPGRYDPDATTDTIGEDSGTIVTPAPADSGATTNGPTVTLGAITIVPAAASAGATTVDPTTELGGITLIPTPASAGATTVDPTAEQGAITITPAAADAGADTVDPVVQIGGLTIVPTPASCGATTNDPTIVFGAVTVVPTAADCGATTNGPTVLAGGVTITPTPASAGATTVDPGAILGGVTIVPAAAASGAVVVDPTITLGGLTLVPAAADTGATTNDPRVAAGTVLSQPAASGATTAGPTVVLLGLRITTTPASCGATTANPTVAVPAAVPPAQFLRINLPNRITIDL